MGVHMNGGETHNSPSDAQAEEVAEPGWYPDPYGDPVLRRWDGERWTPESKLWPTPDVVPAPFNWPALVATVIAVGYGVSWLRGGPSVLGFYLSPLLLMLFGALGANHRYASSKGPGYFTALVLAVAGAGLIVLFLVGSLILAEILSDVP